MSIRMTNPASLTLRDFTLSQYWPTIVLAPSWHRTVQRYVIPCILDDLGRTRLVQVSPQLVRAWWARQQTRHRAPETANKCLTRIKHIFKMAIEWELLEKSPARGIRKLRVPRGRTRYLTDEQRERILSVARDPLRAYIVAGLYGGGRRRDIFDLEERDVDQVKMLVTYRDTKNGEDHVVPIHPMLWQILQPRLTGNPAKKVFDDYRSRDAMSASFKRLARRLGLGDLRFHDVRHDLGTRLAKNKQSQRVIMDVLGHKDPRMSLRYTHAAEETVRGALNELG